MHRHEEQNYVWIISHFSWIKEHYLRKVSGGVSNSSLRGNESVRDDAFHFLTSLPIASLTWELNRPVISMRYPADVQDR